MTRPLSEPVAKAGHFANLSATRLALLVPFHLLSPLFSFLMFLLFFSELTFSLVLS